MSVDSSISTSMPAGAGHVALLLPATAAVPEPAWRIKFLKALLLYWLVPGRLGPHLAVDTWTRALAAHLLSALFVLVAIAWVVLHDMGLWRGDRSFHGLREQIASWILDLAMHSSSATFSLTTPLLVVGVVPLVHVGLALIAILAMPWCAGGDSAWSVFKRSLKNVYWATTLVMPISLGYVIAYHVEPQVSMNRLGTYREYGFALVVLGAMGAIVFLVFRALTAGAGQYVGDAVGPAFGPREPLCEGCGYRITGLPVNGRCPECGMPVADSLPGGRRRTTVWQQYEFSPRGIAELVHMQKRVLLDPGFLETLPVQEGLSSARHFWWGTFLLIGLVSLVSARVVPIITQIVLADPQYHWYDRFEGVLASLAALSVPFAGQAVMLFAACLWAQVRLGIRDYRVSATVCYYASPLMWPLMVIVLVSAFVVSSRLGEMIGGWSGVHILGIALTGPDLLGMVVGGLAIGAIVFWWWRLCRGLRAARYANG